MRIHPPRPLYRNVSLRSAHCPGRIDSANTEHPLGGNNTTQHKPAIVIMVSNNKWGQIYLILTPDDSCLFAPDAARCGRVYVEPARINLFPAHIAIPEVPGLDSPQGPLNPNQPRLTTPGDLLRHLLRLHRIHAGQPPDTCLIQLDRPRGLPRGVSDAQELRLQLKQTLSEFFCICFIHTLVQDVWEQIKTLYQASLCEAGDQDQAGRWR